MNTSHTQPTAARRLAVLGGAPIQRGLHVGRPKIGDRARFLARVNDMLDGRWLSKTARLYESSSRKSLT